MIQIGRQSVADGQKPGKARTRRNLLLKRQKVRLESRKSLPYLKAGRVRQNAELRKHGPVFKNGGFSKERTLNQSFRW
ncbi:hypothetical protein B4135_0301 [Caldibacillus debilis]|uniref:Uncharacterized protein n=1 Tax=Caldibacillus debilis TaxID=301148 RepID=A0A150M459_9BACI|nr:hypothetical protein B4135_0301 [Caldibacillus debilis]